MYIRSVRLADLLHLNQLRQQTLSLNLPETVVHGLRPWDMALLSWLPATSRMRTFVLGDSQPRAFIQVVARDRGHRWEVVHLGSEAMTATCDEPNHPWLLLLNSTAIVAGRRRVTRLVARVPEAAPELACFRQAGYQVYGRELIYSQVMTAGEPPPSEGPELRAQRASDAWQIHRLYFQTAPRTVQDAEAQTSNHWELPRQQVGGVREGGWLIEEEAETVAYARTLSRRHTHMVEWLFQPAQRDRLPLLVRQTLAHLPAGPGDHVYCRVPEYQAELDGVLREAGFVLSGSQAQLVKYLAVKIAARERAFAPAKLAKGRGAPSYLRRASGE